MFPDVVEFILGRQHSGADRLGRHEAVCLHELAASDDALLVYGPDGAHDR